MAVGNFNWHSPRAQHARLGRKLALWTPLILVLAVLLVASGGYLLYIGLSVGWLLFVAVPPLMMTVEWYRHELKSVPPLKQGERVDDILDADILALIPEQPSPKNIAEAIGATTGGYFLAARFGISASFLRDIVSDDRDQTGAVFIEAINIASQVGRRISASVLALALLRQVPESARKTFLGHLQLDEDDIIRGAQWYHHITTEIVAEKRHAEREGGIGRDWSFGWIPNLSRFGSNISRNSSRARQDVRGETLRQLIDAFGRGGETVALVGKVGVGKTELVYELADTLMHPDETIPESIRYNQVFLLSASRLLSVAGQGDELSSRIQILLGEALRAKNVIVCLDNAELFMEDVPGSVDLLSTLVPILEAKRVRLILTLDEQRYLQISQRAPELAAAVRRINVQPTSESDTIKVLQDHVAMVEAKHRVTVMYQALKESYTLGKRYVYDVAMPGQAMSLLEASSEYAEDGLVSLRSVNRAIEAMTGVKTAIADGEEERDLLLHLEDRLHERMVGQDKAVHAVSDALRRARAGVRNKNRPVGTFLFLGPTGVGKTELAKALAETYFNGEKNIVRLDMNEFVSSADVARLIADGADNPNSLTAQVMKQPFTVVLLDEIEKAHSSVLTTLLQLLDEGVLRDERNREVSFRDAIVIATSNAGSDRIQEYIHRGYSLEQFEEEFINELIGGHVFHPEFLNRFDEMVVFGPLSKTELLTVVDRILAGVNKTLEAQSVSVTLEDDAKAYLVEHGYDPRLGARPLRRIVQKAVESTVATMLLEGKVEPGQTVELTFEQVSQAVDTKNHADTIVASAQ